MRSYRRRIVADSEAREAIGAEVADELTARWQ